MALAGRWNEVVETQPVVDAARCPIPDPGEASAEARDLSRALGITITVGDVLHRAGRAVDDDTRRFLEPRLVHLTPPEQMADRTISAERIARAIRSRERICVFGDYDCDGITSAAIITGILRTLGGEVTTLLATRREGAYGLSAKALARVRATGATLLITCDCGSSDHERLASARAAGIDAVVVDHHLVPAEPLPALAFLNPHRADCGFPYKGLASCGLVLSLGAAVRRELGATLDLRPWLDLVAVGTVADVAPLTGDNRALVRAGLSVIASGARPGLRALAGLAKLDLGHTPTAEDVAFRIAPRINAPGRLGDPDLALELLLERDATTAAAIAASIEQITLQRRALQETMITEALAEIERLGSTADPAIVLGSPSWHPGVVGIVAGRIASRFGRPTIVVAIEGATGRGSVRGPPGFCLYDALERCRDVLVGFGGHQAAAGVEVHHDRIATLRERFCGACAELGADASAGGPRPPDVRLDDRDDPAAVLRDLARLEPCGEANRPPDLLIPDAAVRQARDVKGHLKLELDFGRHVLPAFGFDLGALAADVAGGRVDVVGRLRRDSWRGGGAAELRIERVVRR